MPYMIDPKTKKRVDLDPITGQPIGMAGAQQQPQDEGNIFQRLAKAIMAPAVKSGRTIATGAETAADWFQAATGRNTNAFNEDLIPKEYKLNQQEEQQIREHPVQEAVKQSAGLASYIFPAGKLAKGAGFIPTVIQGAKTGFGAGSLYGLSQSEKNDAIGMGTDALAGGIAGGATGGVVSGVGYGVGKAAGAVGKGMVNKGDAMRRGVIKPEVPASPFTIEEEKAIQQTLQKEGAHGSANAQKEQLPTIFRNITQKIEDRLKLTTTKPRIREIRTMVEDALDNNVNYDEAIPSMTRAKDKYINQIVAGLKQGKGLSGLFKVKQNLGGQLTSAFNKLEKGVQLTDKEEVAMTVWKTIDDIITSKDPAIKNLTLTQSYLYKSAPGIMKQANKSLTVPILGNLGTTASRGVQATKDLLGRGMQATGGAVDSATNQMSNFMSGKIPLTGTSVPEMSSRAGILAGSSMALPGQQQAGQGSTEPQTSQPTVVATDPNGEWQTMSDGKSYSMDNQWVFDEASDDWVPNPAAQGGQGGMENNQTNPQAPASLEQYNAVLSKLAGSSSTAAVRQYGLLKQERDYYYPQEKSANLSEGDKKFAFAGKEAQKALTALDSIKSIPVGPVSGSGVAQNYRMLTGGMSKEETNFLSKVAIARTAARNALLGANMSDKEIESLLEFTFDASKPKEVLRQRIASFIDSMNTYVNEVAGPEKLQNFVFPQQ